jgi:hypothetical protein
LAADWQRNAFRLPPNGCETDLRKAHEGAITCKRMNIVKYHDMNRTVLIERIEEAREILEKLLALLQSAPLERDRFVSHLYQSQREYRRSCEMAGKSGKRIERCIISSFQIAESIGFKGDFRQWEGLLRVGE